MSKFSMIFTNKSPFKHGDGSGVSPATQEMLDTKMKFSENMPLEGDYTQEQYDAHDAALEAYRARINAGE
tara:strand:- start:416 stop:625 length:210 start_codon:yes stop_codon:yes gene_type:complete